MAKLRVSSTAVRGERMFGWLESADGDDAGTGPVSGLLLEAWTGRSEGKPCD